MDLAMTISFMSTAVAVGAFMLSLITFVRAEREKVAFGPELAVQSVYEISEPLEKLLPAISQ